MQLSNLILIANIVFLSSIAIADPLLKPLNNEEAAALLSSRPSPTSNPTNLCSETLNNSSGKMERTLEQIRCNIDNYGERLNNTYQRALLRNPKLEGSIVLNIVIAPDGQVTEVTAVENNTNDNPFANAVAAKFKTIKFPAQNVEQWSGKHTLNFYSGY